MGRSTKQQSLETRQHILDAAIQEFSRRGVTSTSLNDIALAAGVTRGAIYWHFKNKVDIFIAMWAQVESSIDDEALRYRNEFSSDPIRALRQTLIYVLQLTETDIRRRNLLAILFHKCEFVGELISFNKYINPSIYKTKSASRTRCVNVLKRGNFRNRWICVWLPFPCGLIFGG